MAKHKRTPKRKPKVEEAPQVESNQPVPASIDTAEVTVAIPPKLFGFSRPRRRTK